MSERWTCMICDTTLSDDYEPGMCCSGYECGCQGMPTNPPICSQVCWDKMLANIKLASEAPPRPLPSTLGEIDGR